MKRMLLPSLLLACLPMASGCSRAIETPAEARATVERIADAAVAFAKTQRSSPKLPMSSDWTPRGAACAQPERRFPVDAALWQTPPWSDIGVRLERPTRYQFRLTRVGAPPHERLLVEGRGDLDCNGVLARFSLTVDDQLAKGPLVEDHATE